MYEIYLNHVIRFPVMNLVLVTVDITVYRTLVECHHVLKEKNNTS